jgi:rhodanese-related sulfurtransferase
MQTIQTITIQELKQRMDAGENIHLLDVREPSENAEFNIGGVLLPLGEIRNMQTEAIDNWKHDEIVIYCRSGNRSGIAAQILDQLGFENAKNLTGGMLAWQQNFGAGK